MSYRPPDKASEAKPPDMFPITGPIRQPLAERRYFPSAAFDFAQANARAIENHGYGLATLATQGGLHVVLLAKVLLDLPLDAEMSRENAEEIVAAEIARHERAKRKRKTDA